MTPPVDPLPERIVFFDGVCGLCSRTVDNLLARDTEARLRFAPLQGETAGALRAEHPERFPEHLDSIVYAESEGGETTFSTRSEAAFRIARVLGIGGPSGVSPRSSARIVEPSLNGCGRASTFDSSRTLPGQW